MVATQSPRLARDGGATLVEARVRIHHAGCLAELLPPGVTLTQLSGDRAGGLFFLAAQPLQPTLDVLSRDPRFRCSSLKRDGTGALLRLTGDLACPHAGGEAAPLWPWTYRDGEESGRLLFGELSDLRRFVERGRGDGIRVEGTSLAPLAAVPVSINVSGLAGGLTAKQLDVLRTAMAGGYYEIPRAVTTEVLAKRFDISRTTYDEHLRKGEQAILRHVLHLLGTHPALGAAAMKPRGRPKRAS